MDIKEVTPAGRSWAIARDAVGQPREPAFSLRDMLAPELHTRGQTGWTSTDTPHRDDAFAALLPPVIEVRDLSGEREMRRRSAERIGRMVSARTVEVKPVDEAVESPIKDSAEAVRLAAEGDPVARQMLTENVASDRSERGWQAGNRS